LGIGLLNKNERTGDMGGERTETRTRAFAIRLAKGKGGQISKREKKGAVSRGGGSGLRK